MTGGDSYHQHPRGRENRIGRTLGLSGVGCTPWRSFLPRCFRSDDGGNKYEPGVEKRFEIRIAPAAGSMGSVFVRR